MFREVPGEIFAGEPLVAASPACALLLNHETGHFLWANSTAYETLGVPRNRPELLRSRVEPGELTGPVFDADRRSSVLWRYSTPSGRWHTTDVTQQAVQAFDNENNGVRAVLVQFVDVQRESRFAEELHQTASYIEALSRRTAAGLLVLSDAGVVLHATDRAVEQLALARDEVVGVPIDLLARVHTADSFGWTTALAAMDPIATVRVQLSHSFGKPVWLGGTLERVSDSEPGEILMTVHDISDNVRREQQRTKELEHENYRARYTMMGDLAMAVAHELGQPLTAANNFIAGSSTEVQRAHTAGTDPLDLGYVMHGMDNAARQIERASKVISSMRSFVGHLDRVQQTVDLSDIVDECLYFVRLRAEAASVEIDYLGSSASVRCERVLTGQVVMNLCFNAIEEMAEIRPKGPSLMRLRTVASDGVGMFVVEDQGRGIDRDPFATSFTSKADGSGIGLALCHRIITRQNGTIWARRLEGSGSQFGFSLPIDPAPTLDR